MYHYDIVTGQTLGLVRNDDYPQQPESEQWSIRLIRVYREPGTTDACDNKSQNI